MLGAGFTGSGTVLLAGLRWAIEQGFDVINMSLSTTKKPFAGVLHELADSAYFQRTVLVASAHNMPVESYPWRFSSVISVGSHEEADPLAFFYNPSPPVEFFARGVERRGAWLGGAHAHASPGTASRRRTCAAICALVLGEASRADAVPAQERALPDRDERRRWTMTERADLRAAVAAGVVGSEESFRALLRVDRRGRARDLRRQGVVDLPARRGDRRARLRGGRRRGRGHAPRQRFPAGTGIAGWVLATRQPLVIEDVHNDPRFARTSPRARATCRRG